MSILNIQPMQIGASGVQPNILLIQTNDVEATILATGYLSGQGQFWAIDFSNYQIAAVYCTDTYTNWYQVQVTSGGVATLVASEANPFAVSVQSVPVVDKHFAVFYGTTGKIIQDLAYVPSDVSKTKVVMASAATTIGRVPQFDDIAGTIGDGPVAANVLLTSAITTPDVGANLIAFDVTVGQAALAAAGSVTLYTSSSTKQYKIRALWANSGGTNFSGGGGDRLLSITDNTTVYSLVPAASLQTLVNAGWGVTALPFPAAAAINVSTAAGASLVAKYSGGTADYTAGSVVISGLLQRVA